MKNTIVRLTLAAIVALVLSGCSSSRIHLAKPAIIHPVILAAKHVNVSVSAPKSNGNLNGARPQQKRSR